MDDGERSEREEPKNQMMRGGDMSKPQGTYTVLLDQDGDINKLTNDK